jgi:outer membrane protein OmpA-like peptidoglycan-associated protein
MCTYRYNRLLIGALGAIALTSVSGLAAAQGLALDRFTPAPAGDRMFGVESPYVAGHLTPHVMLLGEYARDPLVLRSETSSASSGAVVSDQFFLHLNGSLALWNRLNVNVDVPVAMAQGGDSPGLQGQRMASPSGVAFGDLRAGLRLRLFGDYADAFQLSLGGYMWFPTGASNSYVSDGTVRGRPELIVGGHTDRFVWSMSFGPEIRGSQQFGQVHQGTMLAFGYGMGVLLGEDRQFQIGPELTVSTTATNVSKRSSNAELLLGARYRFLHDLEAGVAAGPGLGSGIGTPEVRALAMLAYTPEQKPSDRDRDGIVDASDACPDEAGVASEDPTKHGCPLPKDTDKDGIVDPSDACPSEAGVASEDPKKHGCPLPKDMDKDGIVDAEDACPSEAGVASDDPKKHGCPLPADRDADGIPDAVDACPDLKGVADPDPGKNGCPPDTDGDSIRDDKDACPNEKGPADPDPEKNGCPKAVRVTAGEIVILQQVQFDTGKATIKPVSDALLTEVAEVLAQHLEITQLEVQGHTDNVGFAKFNKTLSQKRAEAVVAALVKRGIANSRLAAQGFGQEAPVADNKTADGRQKNRRVQFKIVSKAQQDSTGK